MNRAKLSTIAHSDHVFCNPIGDERVDRVLGLLDLGPGQKALDVGCGKAEMLLRLIERYGVRAVGVDTNPRYLEAARAGAAARLADPAALELHEAEAVTVPLPDASFDAALCIGSTHAFVSYARTLRALKRLVAPGGRILIGEGFWRCDPDDEYLAQLGARRDEFLDHSGTIERGVQEGLVPLYASVSNDDEWDHYEGLYCRAVELYAARHPDDPDSPAMQRYIRSWREMYQRWGRRTLGFGLYLFLRPPQV